MKTQFCAAGIAAILLAAPIIATAQEVTAPSFADIFTSHAVLQRDKPIEIWGNAAPNSALNINLGTSYFQATADTNGKWRVTLPATPKGGPFTLRVQSESGFTTLNDIMIGDVFLCSGQSNMEFPLSLATNSWNELKQSTQNNLRFITIARNPAPTPQITLLGSPKWQVTNQQTMGETSAVCYYMAKNISVSQSVTVGMIHSSWGGSQVEAWMSRENLGKFDQFKTGLDELSLYIRDPAAAANAMNERQTAATSNSDIGLRENFKSNNYSDATWIKLSASDNWENAGISTLSNFDGIGWYRFHINLTAAQARLGCKIKLGPIDDGDITYINGQTIGATDGWDKPRTYDILPSQLRAGDNLIAIRVLDTGGGGGPYNNGIERVLELSDGTKIPLPAQWSFKVSAPLSQIPLSTSLPWGGANGLTTLYNGMIAPIAPYGIRGIAWYQGESNARRADAYRELLPAMVEQWRSDFNDPNIGFFNVQLSSFGTPLSSPSNSNWGNIRNVQREIANIVPNSAMIVSLDVGDRIDIHPTQKSVVGNRLANAARNVLYGENLPQSPTPIAAKLNGNQIEVEFANSYDGLKAFGSNLAIGFETCNAARICQFAYAQPNGNKIILTGSNLAGARFVRYAWGDTVYLNLFNSANLPIGSFEIAITSP